MNAANTENVHSATQSKRGDFQSVSCQKTTYKLFELSFSQAEIVIKYDPPAPVLVKPSNLTGWCCIGKLNPSLALKSKWSPGTNGVVRKIQQQKNPRISFLTRVFLQDYSGLWVEFHSISSLQNSHSSRHFWLLHRFSFLYDLFKIEIQSSLWIFDAGVGVSLAVRGTRTVQLKKESCSFSVQKFTHLNPSENHWSVRRIFRSNT